MNKQAVKKKHLILAFLGYVVLTVALSIGLSMVWQAGLDTSQLTHEELMALAQESWIIQHGSKAIGSSVAMLIGLILAIKAKGVEYRTAVYFGLVLVAYGVLSIVLNPHEGVLDQALKVLMPVPLTVLGAWMAMQLKFRKVAQPI